MLEIGLWAEDYGKMLDEIAAEFNLDADHAAERKANLVALKTAAIEEILSAGLDIGGIVKYVVKVTLEKHPQDGWVFVRENGKGFPIYNHVRI